MSAVLSVFSFVSQIDTQKLSDLVIGHIIKHLLDLCGVFHWSGHWVG